MIVSGACRGDHYVKYPSWYDIFLLYRVFAPGVLNWTFRILIASHGARTSMVGTGKPPLEGTSPRNLLTSPITSHRRPQQMRKLE